MSQNDEPEDGTEPTETPAVLEGTAREIAGRDDEGTEPDAIPPATVSEIPTGAELVTATPANPPSAIMPLEPEAVIEGMAAYQALIPRLLSDSDYQGAGGGKRFVKKSGWRKIARAFGLSSEIRSQHVERDDDGQPLRANVVVRAIHAPTGQYQDGDGGCSVAEERFSGSRGNRSKLENDLIATATTRAKNRAISDLVGMGDVSAEEVSGTELGPPWGPEATTAQRQTCGRALAYLHDNDREAARVALVAAEKASGGYLPLAVVNGIVIAAEIVKARQEPSGAEESAATKAAGDAAAEEPEPDTSQPTEGDDAPGDSLPDPEAEKAAKREASLMADAERSAG